MSKHAERFQDDCIGESNDKFKDEFNDEFIRDAADQVMAELSENPGAAIAVDPDVAAHMGAFEEDALSPEDAEDAEFDQVAPSEDEQLDGGE
jgi:triosephosphate isomerase